MKKNKIAKALLRQRDPKKRRMMMIGHVIVAVLCGIGLNISSLLGTRLNPMLEVFLCVVFACVLINMLALRRFPAVAEFIDWEKVESIEKEERAFSE